MAIMTLPICIPQTPSPATSPPSDDSQNNNNNNNIQNNNTTDSVPPTPVSPTIQQKRKPSRRANTAERRATHNAVERQRRETLNSRFLVILFFSFLIPIFNFNFNFFKSGFSCLTPQSLSNKTSFQIFHCKFLNRTYPCFSSSSSSRRS